MTTKEAKYWYDDMKDELVKLAKVVQGSDREAARDASRKMGKLLDTLWDKDVGDPPETRRLIADVEFLTGFHYIYP